MSVKNNKKGYVVIECIISIFLLINIEAFCFSIFLNTVKLNHISSEKYNYTAFFESLKNILKYNLNYNDIKQLCSENKIYINSDNINMNSIENKQALDIFTNVFVNKSPYAEISVKDNEIFEITVKLHYKIGKKDEEMECKVYKGNYIIQKE